MKRILLVLVIVAALATPLFAGEAVKVFVNGVQLQTEAVVIDGRTFVPLRAVSESLGASVEWDEVNNAVRVGSPKPKSQTLTRPKIIGDERFTSYVTSALGLLQQYDYPHYVMVCQNVAEIKSVGEINLKGKRALAANNTNDILISSTLIKDDNKFSAEYIAGILVHEGTHALNYNLLGIDHDSNLILHEAMCYENQVAALKLVGASKSAIAEFENWRTRYNR